MLPYYQQNNPSSSFIFHFLGFLAPPPLFYPIIQNMCYFNKSLLVDLLAALAPPPLPLLLTSIVILSCLFPPMLSPPAPYDIPLS